MIVPRLALQSLRNRALTASLTVLAIAFSVMLLLGVEKVRTGARQSLRILFLLYIRECHAPASGIKGGLLSWFSRQKPQFG